jgi:hypothetical protein
MRKAIFFLIMLVSFDVFGFERVEYAEGKYHCKIYVSKDENGNEIFWNGANVQSMSILPIDLLKDEFFVFYDSKLKKKYEVYNPFNDEEMNWKCDYVTIYLPHMDGLDYYGNLEFRIEMMIDLSTHEIQFVKLGIQDNRNDFGIKQTIDLPFRFENFRYFEFVKNQVFTMEELKDALFMVTDVYCAVFVFSGKVEFVFFKGDMFFDSDDPGLFNVDGKYTRYNFWVDTVLGYMIFSFGPYGRTLLVKTRKHKLLIPMILYDRVDEDQRTFYKMPEFE